MQEAAEGVPAAAGPSIAPADIEALAQEEVPGVWVVLVLALAEALEAVPQEKIYIFTIQIIMEAVDFLADQDLLADLSLSVGRALILDQDLTGIEEGPLEQGL